MKVSDLKAKAAPLVGLRVEKQKLLYKGILKDEESLATSKLKDGAKITLMTASR